MNQITQPGNLTADPVHHDNTRMTRTRRILVTGSRAWPWPDVVARALDTERLRLTAADTLIVVHGGCPRGADAAAAHWCARAAASTGATVVEQVYPARWRDEAGRLDRGAGMNRNAQMIAAGADLVLAFWLDRSPGTADTLRRADTARIPALVHRAYTSTPQSERKATGRRGSAHHGSDEERGVSPMDKLDALAEWELHQGYDPVRNPVCGACHVYRSNTGQCLCA